jgi:hypothetical protein
MAASGSRLVPSHYSMPPPRVVSEAARPASTPPLRGLGRSALAVSVPPPNPASLRALFSPPNGGGKDSTAPGGASGAQSATAALTRSLPAAAAAAAVDTDAGGGGGVLPPSERVIPLAHILEMPSLRGIMAVRVQSEARAVLSSVDGGAAASGAGAAAGLPPGLPRGGTDRALAPSGRLRRGMASGRSLRSGMGASTPAAGTGGAEAGAGGDAGGDRPAAEEVHAVTMHVLNPKAVSQADLYGSFDLNTHEWNDGVLALTVRHCARDTSRRLKWVVYDGPVDAIWIEVGPGRVLGGVCEMVCV